MVITYHGKSFLKITQGETVLALNPIGKDSKEKQTRFGADVAFISLNHPDYNGIEAVTYGEREPVAIAGPGDYEVKDIFIHGTGVATTFDKKPYIATLYSIEIEGVKIGVVGPVNEMPESKDTEILTGADILFVPVGTDFLSAAKAYKLAVTLEPSVIIPIEYDETTLKAFLKEAGAEKVERLDKLVAKKKDLAGKEAEVMVLERV